MCEVSIIVPMHNSQEFIESCLESLFDQTFSNFEILLIDDGSSDESLDKVKKIQHDKRLSVLENPSNLGAASARNLGTLKAQGRYIAFCDSDDIWRTDKLETQLAYMKSNGAAVSHTSVYYTNETRKVLIKAKPVVRLSDMKTRNWIPNSSGIYDASKIGKVFQTKFRHEDYEMWCDTIERGGPSIGVAEPLVEINRRKDSLSGNKLRSLGWHFQAQRRIFSMGHFELYLHFIKNLTLRLAAALKS